MAKTATRRTTVKAQMVPVECDGCGVTFTMTAREHERHMLERDVWSCPNGCRRQFLAPRRTFADLEADVVAQASRVVEQANATMRALLEAGTAVHLNVGTIGLEEAEATLARIARELETVALTFAK